MNAGPQGQSPEPDDDMAERVARKAARRLKARSERRHNLWFGLGMFGLVGWSVAIPTIVGIAVGVWIDRTWPGPISWTLTLLFVGMVIGCLTAWRWLKREGRV